MSMSVSSDSLQRTLSSLSLSSEDPMSRVSYIRVLYGQYCRLVLGAAARSNLWQVCHVRVLLPLRLLSRPLNRSTLPSPS